MGVCFLGLQVTFVHAQFCIHALRVYPYGRFKFTPFFPDLQYPSLWATTSPSSKKKSEATLNGDFRQQVLI